MIDNDQASQVKQIADDYLRAFEALLHLVDVNAIEETVPSCRAIRGSGLSVSNNIAEGSGSGSKREFSNVLNIARRSTFENANVILVLEKRRLIEEGEVSELLALLDRLCRKITSFQRSLNA